MNFKQILWSIVLPLTFGLLGGVAGRFITPAFGPKSATFETVHVTNSLIVSPDASEKGCRMSSDGTVVATGGVVAHQVRGDLVIGRSLVASLNPTKDSLENQQIAGEMSATADRGGLLVLRNQEANLCPAKGPVSRGYETFLGFDKDKGTPSIYTQDIAQGPMGQSFFVCVKPKQGESKPQTANATNASSAEQPSMR
jgi:hypothetical protein